MEQNNDKIPVSLDDIENEKKKCIEKIKTYYYKEDYEKINNFLQNLKNNCSSEKILELSYMIKEYKNKYEYNPLNIIKNKIKKYNNKFQNTDVLIDENQYISDLLIESDDIIGYNIFAFVLSALRITLKEFLNDKFNLIKNDLKNNLKNIKEDFIKLINNFEVDNDLSNEEIKNITNQVYKFINGYKKNFCNILDLFKFLKEDASNFILIIQKLFVQNLDKEKYNDFILKSIPIKTFFISYISEEKKVYLMKKLKKMYL